jgi:glycolate oxidase iron-sulfur subunit
MSEQILEEKMEDLLGVQPEVVVTANPGCQMQLEAGLRARGRQEVAVKHLAEVLAAAY